MGLIRDKITRAELLKQNVHFLHPSATKLYDLIRRLIPSEMTPGTLKLLQKIGQACAICVTHQVKGLLFKVSLPDEELEFNKDLAIDIK